jgi:hypothetical protein
MKLASMAGGIWPLLSEIPASSRSSRTRRVAYHLVRLYEPAGQSEQSLAQTPSALDEQNMPRLHHHRIDGHE